MFFIVTVHVFKNSASLLNSSFQGKKTLSKFRFHASVPPYLSCDWIYCWFGHKSVLQGQQCRVGDGWSAMPQLRSDSLMYSLLY